MLRLPLESALTREEAVVLIVAVPETERLPPTLSEVGMLNDNGIYFPLFIFPANQCGAYTSRRHDWTGISINRQRPTISGPHGARRL